MCIYIYTYIIYIYIQLYIITIIIIIIILWMFTVYNYIYIRELSTMWLQFWSFLHAPCMLVNNPICEPWCWYIYLQNWVVLFGHMLVCIFQHHGSMGIWIQQSFPLQYLYLSEFKDWFLWFWPAWKSRSCRFLFGSDAEGCHGQNMGSCFPKGYPLVN